MNGIGDDDDALRVVRRRRPAAPRPEPVGAAAGPADDRSGDDRSGDDRSGDDRFDDDRLDDARSGAARPDDGRSDDGDDYGDDDDGDGDDYVVLPPAQRGGRRVLAVLAAALAVVGIGIGLLVVWATRQVDPAGEAGALVAVEVPRGATTSDIAGLLADAEVITDARLFTYYAGWKDAGPWEAGSYPEFRRGSSFTEAIAVLDAGPVPADARLVRIPEGRTLEQALAIIAESVPGTTVEALRAALDSGAVTSKYKPADVSSWEGLLFPDTYEFEDGTAPAAILQTMATKMDRTLDELGYDRAVALRGRSAYELVIIASLIERETGAPPQERGQIARVIFNRLDDDETLGIDAANLYGLGRTSGGLTQSDLEDDNPYNTRINRGLPPTPIALPGRASLEAAITPADGDWKFYVLVENDPPRHLFTASYREFLRAKDDAQARGVF